MTSVADAWGEYGPLYPNLGATVAKLRSAYVADRNRNPGKRDYESRTAYGYAVLRAILSLQRSELQRELPSHAPHCASGTAHTRGEDICRAMREKHRRALLAAPDQIRRQRTPDEWKRLYEEAMAEKRAAADASTIRRAAA